MKINGQECKQYVESENKFIRELLIAFLQWYKDFYPENSPIKDAVDEWIEYDLQDFIKEKSEHNGKN